MNCFRNSAATLPLYFGLVAWGATIPSAARSAEEARPASQLVETLQAGTASEKIEAADQLATRRDARELAVPALVESLDDPDASVRWHAARALGALGVGTEGVIAALRQALEDEASAVRINAAMALGRIGSRSEATVRELARLAAAEDTRVARAAIQALRMLRAEPKLVVQALSEALRQEDQAVAMLAVEGLVACGQTAMPVLVEALEDERAAYWACIAIEELGADSEEAVSGLITLLQETTDPQTRLQATLALAATGPPAREASSELADLLASGQGLPQRRAAAYALGMIGGDAADRALSEVVDADDPFLGMIAAWGLANLKPDDPMRMERAVRRLTQALGSDDPLLRTAAAEGLVRLEAPPEEVVPALIAVASDPDASVVANVIEGLASLGTPVIPRAVKALERPELRDVAIEVLHRLGSQAKEAVGALADAISGEDPEFTLKVQEVLADLGPDAAPATPALVGSLTSADQRVRHTAIYALGRIGPKAAAAVSPLRDILERGDKQDQIAAAWALVHIRPDDSDLIRTALPHLIEGLASDNPLIRQEMAFTLGELGTAAQDAAGRLRELAAHDPNTLVREAARDAAEMVSPAP